MEEQPRTSPLLPPARIRRLPESVVNRIAAGEVVVRPSAALKELLENSLDAHATSITITVRDGGIKLLQVSDDGHGISRTDLPLLCQRFATSKLREFGDLANVATFGFRGEALASVSHVSRLSVLTMRAEDSVAYKAAYLDGVMRDEPQPTAGVRGTTIIIEDMFYNLPTRRSAIKSPSDEYRAIVDVVSRYAIRYSNVAFICRRNQPAAAARLVSASDVRTDRDASLIDNVRAAFGSVVANEVIMYDVQVPVASATVGACVTSANFSMKKAVFVLFINGRLVDCQPFKRAVLAAYGCYLPKGGHPFTYFDVKMQQADIDVNVHPTKKEVRFLHDDAIVDAVVESLMEKLKTTETSRTFMTQSVIATGESQLRAERPEPNSVEGEVVGVEDTDMQPNLCDGEAADTEDFDSHSGGNRALELCDEDSSTEARLEGPRVEVDGDREGEDNGLGAFERVGLKMESTSAEQRTNEDVIADSEMEDQESLRQAGRRPTQMHFESAKLRSDEKKRPLMKAKSIYAKDKVRSGSHAPVGLFDVYLARNSNVAEAVWVQSRRKRSGNAIPMLTSIETMLRDAERSMHSGLAGMLKDHLFVGVASEQFVLLQHGTRLLLAEISPIVEELMYQQSLIRFADHEKLLLDPPAPVMRLLKHYVNGTSKMRSARRLSAETCTSILLDKASMLSEYFGISLTGLSAADAKIETLPLLFPSVVPDMKYFGQFLYSLASDTDWSEEGPCLGGITRCLGRWYGNHWTPLPSEAGEETNTSSLVQNGSDRDAGQQQSGEAVESGLYETERREWVLRHILFASLRKDFYPPRKFSNDKVIREITSTSKLYKIFERC